MKGIITVFIIGWMGLLAFALSHQRAFLIGFLCGIPVGVCIVFWLGTVGACMLSSQISRQEESQGDWKP